ncbi:phage major tail protein, TP901-1 family [Listeria monocytogenes]|uniref:phage major tail protein, TP901-1 family n=1 Tax=Listeria farberi TaxID=2713500 RepID=UPI0010EC4A9F|nr:phage major tail protein, TP901-1 family [Listeria farberi]EAC6755219.1 phage major tail protein, TP901-1 family [Listeria monocytogenes]EIX7078187.1 phage major tail protein, TP901-1 family [Listeria innocua]EAC7891601.1 phage major tail protein, TP901-1 family [Listeria monocytogenes]EAC8616899.1 phage major tail protein, TP901-1 family [Listeria monocytogenes]EAC9739388.1 phage major tail protein, TP901-1 family [Listeria monocytogenes]
MALEYTGSDIIYLVTITGDAGEKYVRPFNQTDGNTSVSADDVELETKDKSETGYGKVSQTVSFGAIMTTGDVAFPFLLKALRKKQYVPITELDIKTKKGEKGLYKLNSFERDNGNGDNVQLSVEAALSGEITEVTLTEIPDGAPANEADETPATPPTE